MATEVPGSSSAWNNIGVSNEATSHIGHNYDYGTHIHVTASQARDVYRNCIRSTATSFQSLAVEVASFRSLLELTAETLESNTPKPTHAERFSSIMSACNNCLQDLQRELSTYNELPTSTQRTWERMNWGADRLSELQGQLGRNITLLSTLNNTISNASQAAVQKMLQKFVDEVRSGQREGSVVSRNTIDSLSMDERTAWRILRKELEDVGITPDLFCRHKDFIKSTLQEIISSGALQEQLPNLSKKPDVEELDPRPVSVVPPSKEIPKPLLSRLEIYHEDFFHEAQTIKRPSLAAKALSKLFGREKELRVAIEKLDHIRVQYLLEAGAKIKQESASECVYLLIDMLPNVYKDNPHIPETEYAFQIIATLLFRRGINVDHFTIRGHPRGTLIRGATKIGQVRAVRFFLESGAWLNPTLLHIACEQGYNDIVDLFLRKDVRIEECDLLGDTPLLLACRNGHEVIASQLLVKGANINKQSDKRMTPLFIACQNGHENIANLLLKKGADINKQSDERMTPLFIACQNGHENIANLLLQKGADINKQSDERMTPLFIACQNGHENIANLLLKKGADTDINKKNEKGKTPLLIACRRGDVSIVNLLLKYGADKEITATESMRFHRYTATPLWLAVMFCHVEVVQALITSGVEFTQRCEKFSSQRPADFEFETFREYFGRKEENWIRSQDIRSLKIKELIEDAIDAREKEGDFV